MAVLFNPKIFGTEHWNFWTVFEQSETDFRTICAVFFFFLVIARKMNNMLVV